MHRKQLKNIQRNELSEHILYKHLAKYVKNGNNRKLLEQIASKEYEHYQTIKKITKTDVTSKKLRIFWYNLLSRLFGLSFGLRLMERGEILTQKAYEELKEELPEVADVIIDEQEHEVEILSMIKEDQIEYAGAIVLGLNDALVELTGALAGLTFALQDNKTIAMAGLITGVAASMSMAASELLSAREVNSRKPVKSAVYTGVAYISTVVLLIFPYLITSKVYLALTLMLFISILIILGYNFYITTAKGIGLWRRFAEMAGISLTVAVISFLVGIAARSVFGVEI